ncbi:fur family transcriptional regulator FurA3 [Pseudonocardia ailaonensis]|uniref:Fur family transcriptional regulator FurA3 n=1 Tax=Pseudonocardia ailaonensis TaxID=367279 RepID=A0ABN2NMK5_9PSEU
MDDPTTLLRAKGLRSTPHRRAVLAALRERSHATVVEVAEDVARLGAAAGPAAVSELSRQGLYNVLEDLRRVDLVRSIEPAGSPTRFELQHGDNHHHLVCRVCGTVRDVPCATGTAPCLTPSDQADFVIDEAEVLWWGTCGACAATRGGA